MLPLKSHNVRIAIVWHSYSLIEDNMVKCAQAKKNKITSLALSEVYKLKGVIEHESR